MRCPGVFPSLPLCCCCFFQREAEPDIPIVAQLPSLPGLLGSDGNPKNYLLQLEDNSHKQCGSTVLWCYLYIIHAQNLAHFGNSEQKRKRKSEQPKCQWLVIYSSC